MNKFDLEKRTMQYALKVIEFVAAFPQTKAAAVIEYQLVKSGTAAGANYREAKRGESRADLIHKIGIVEKEAVESAYWVELCELAKMGDQPKRAWLLQESRELLAIFTSVGRSTKANRAKA